MPDALTPEDILRKHFGQQFGEPVSDEDWKEITEDEEMESVIKAALGAMEEWKSIKQNN